MIIDAIKMCEDRKIKQKKDVELLTEKLGYKPKFVIINASDNPANARYVENKIKQGTEVGLDMEVLKFESDCSNEDILNVINYCKLKKYPVILQLPTFEHLDSEELIKSIDYTIDADGFSKEWIGEVNLGNDKLVAPATPKGVIQLLEYHNVEFKGKVALVIGASNHVSKPLASMLLNRECTLLVAHKETKDLNSLIQQADIVISCVGKLDLVKAEYLKQNVVLIGVGFTYVGRKQILDFDLDEVVNSGKPLLVSNRINCTGKTTVNALIDNVIELYKLNF